jgi:hypothetical protein
MSGISRSGPEGAPLTWTSKDVFYLDGQILIPDTSLGGTHRPEFDSGFSKIEKVGETLWEVTAKNGTRSSYEVNTMQSLTKITSWRLSSVSDSYDNQVSYHYSKLDGVDYISKITYGH